MSRTRSQRLRVKAVSVTTLLTAKTALKSWTTKLPGARSTTLSVLYSLSFYFLVPASRLGGVLFLGPLLLGPSRPRYFHYRFRISLPFYHCIGVSSLFFSIYFGATFIYSLSIFPWLFCLVSLFPLSSFTPLLCFWATKYRCALICGAKTNMIGWKRRRARSKRRRRRRNNFRTHTSKI